MNYVYNGGSIIAACKPWAWIQTNKLPYSAIRDTVLGRLMFLTGFRFTDDAYVWASPIVVATSKAAQAN